MNNLKTIIPAAIIFILITTGVYYLYKTQVSNKMDLSFKPSAIPSQNLKEASSSASPKSPGAIPQALSSQPSTGPNDSLNLQTTIAITSPTQASFIKSPLLVKGYANITSQVVELKIKDSNGNTLGLSRASACIGYTACEFTANIVFSKPQTPTGSLEAYSKSTIDGSPTDVTLLDVNFD